MLSAKAFYFRRTMTDRKDLGQAARICGDSVLMSLESDGFVQCEDPHSDVEEMLRKLALETNATWKVKLYKIKTEEQFIEHMREPLSFLEACYALLKPNGKVVVLTPDWEANMKVFYDDVTHVSPLTRESMRQALELAGFEDIQVFRFRQLPVTWNSASMNFLAASIAPLVPPRSKRKFFRWSRELMLCGIASRPADSPARVVQPTADG